MSVSLKYQNYHREAPCISDAIATMIAEAEADGVEFEDGITETKIITNQLNESWRASLEPNIEAIRCYRMDLPYNTTNPVTGFKPVHDLATDEGRTDVANSFRFIDMFKDELLYVPAWKTWLSWDGSRWNNDCGVGAQQRAIRYSQSLWLSLPQLGPRLAREQLASVLSFIRGTNQQSRISSFMSLASTDERVVCQVAELNTDPILINCFNGTLDLATNKIRPHSPADRITQLTSVAYDPNAVCPKWIETLGLIFDGDTELIRYVQQLLGYSISGETGEHILPIAYGSGCNGKSTIWNVVAELLGDYASLASEGLLLGTKDNHPQEKAALYQKRFVAISEPERNSRLRESRVKELTGDRVVTARKLYENEWTFVRTHTLWLSTNHLPRIDGVDDGIWRRVKLIPMKIDMRTKVKPIPDFDKWLIRNEGPGILAWLVSGFMDYQKHGFIEPKCVTDATASYREDSDSLGDFLSEYCIEDQNAITPAKDLFRVYSEDFRGAWKQKTFGTAMAERFRKDKARSGEHRDKTVYFGVALRPSGDAVIRAFDPSNVGENSKWDGSGTIKTRVAQADSFADGSHGFSVPTGPKTCKCGAEMVPATIVGGWQNWDCPVCSAVQPEEVRIP